MPTIRLPNFLVGKDAHPTLKQSHLLLLFFCYNGLFKKDRSWKIIKI